LKPGCDQLFRAARNDNQACKRGARRAGEVYTVRYETVNAMLLNEFLKAHRRIEEQEATIARLQKQIDAVTAGLKKVSAQLEVSKPAQQTVLNNQ
jgi:hypothetical protein